MVIVMVIVMVMVIVAVIVIVMVAVGEALTPYVLLSTREKVVCGGRRGFTEGRSERQLRLLGCRYRQHIDAMAERIV